MSDSTENKKDAGPGPQERDEKAAEKPDAGATQDAGAGPEPEGTDVGKLRAERDDYLDLFRRERASFLNYKKWVSKERATWETDAVARFVERLLPFIDDMDRALTAAEQAEDVEALRDGMKMIHQRFRDALKSGGAKEIATDGQPFDPRIHEAVLQVEDPDRPDGTVLETAQRGYEMGERLIRAAKVVVSKAPAGGRSSDQTDQPAPEKGD